MSLTRQKRVAKKVVNNVVLDVPLTGGEIVESSGYSAATAKNPKVVLESKGVQEELIKMGFTEDKAKETVAEILVAGENDTVKLKAADMVFKVHGTYAPDKHVNLNFDADLSQRERELGQTLRELLA